MDVTDITRQIASQVQVPTLQGAQGIQNTTQAALGNSARGAAGKGGGGTGAMSTQPGAPSWAQGVNAQQWPGWMQQQVGQLTQVPLLSGQAGRK